MAELPDDLAGSWRSFHPCLWFII